MKSLTTDVAIIGGGLAGATAAAMFGREEYDAVLVEPHMEIPVAVHGKAATDIMGRA